MKVEDNPVAHKVGFDLTHPLSTLLAPSMELQHSRVQLLSSRRTCHSWSVPNFSDRKADAKLYQELDPKYIRLGTTLTVPAEDAAGVLCLT